MGWTKMLQDRRMEKFSDIYSRWQDRSLTRAQAGAMLGVTERSFRRYARRYEDEGIEGLFDRRLGAKAARHVPVDELDWMLEQYETRYVGWSVKHFHDHIVRSDNWGWSYTYTKNRLHEAGLVLPAPHKGKHRRKRERRPCRGMLIHQDGSSTLLF